MKTHAALPLMWCTLATFALATPAPPWTGNPMRPGIAAITCTSSGDQTAIGLQEHVVEFVDLRDPIGCAATPINTAPTFWSLGAARLFWPAPSSNDWSVANLGEVFGVDVGTGSTSHVYVAAMGPKVCNWGGNNIWNNRPYNTAGGNTGTGGEVWQINGTTHLPFLLARLPNHKGYFQGAYQGPNTYSCINGNAFVGLGQVSVNTKLPVASTKVYVSNLDDGKIYVLNDNMFNTTYPCVFDHGATKPGSPILDDPNSLYTQKGRLVFGLEYHPQFNRLFYAVRNGSDQDEVWSIGLDATGCPTGTQCLEFVSPSWTSTPMQWSLPGDIQFSDNGCRMLVTQISIRYEVINATNILGTPTFAGPVSQLIPMHYAHTSVGYEAKVNSNPPCNPSFLRWTYLNKYVAGLPYYNGGPFNAIAGDYGYGSLLGTKAIDSVVLMCDVIRPATNSSYQFGLQIAPLGDFTRSMGSANFDAPLLSGNPGILATKIQLNDVDILHRDACVKIASTPVVCPVGQGGQHKMTITITNTGTVPYWGINLTNCPGLPLLPGATPISPVFASPPPINLGNPLLPGASVGPLTVCLPGIPPTGGLYCFCVDMLSEVEGPPLCQEMVCVDVPQCIPPCATIVAQNPVCDQGNYLFSLCVTNLQQLPVTTIKFTPCTDSLGTPLGPTPSPNPYTLVNPLPNGATAYFPFTLPNPFGPGGAPNGGQYCFNVILCGAAPPGGHEPVLCQKKVCLELPPCNPPCMTITATNIKCPTELGGPYTLDLTITNLGTMQAHFATLSQCPNPPPGCTAIVPPNTPFPFSPPLGIGQSATISVSLPNIPCTGIKACLCVTLFNQEPPDPVNPESPIKVICKDSICVDLPACPCPPCVTLTPGAVLCPTAPNGAYSFSFTMTNLHPTPAVSYAVSQCPVPSGYLPVQPMPASGLIPGGPLAQNSTSQPVTVSLAVPLTGGNYCFCVDLFSADDKRLCRELLCVTLPSCRCAEIKGPVEAVCHPSGATQLTFSVTNLTNLYASPFNFELATFSPPTGFTPPQIAPTPNPITPGNVGTFTTFYTGPVGLTCVSVILSNAARTRCCTLKLCFNNPECIPTPTLADTCSMAPEFICENGKAYVTVFICNNSFFPRSYNWSIAPISMLGCGTLPPAAFTPSGGLTPMIGAGSCYAVSIVINTASLPSGQCAGFQFCFSPRGTAIPPTCCTGKVFCGRPADPCVNVGDPHTVISPGQVIGIPIDIKNPTSAVLEADLVPTDLTGALTFTRSLAGDASNSGEIADPSITEENPLHVSLAPGEIYHGMIFAQHTGKAIVVGPGIIIITKPCVSLYDDHLLGTGTVLLGPGGVATPSVGIRDAVGQLSKSQLGGHAFVRIPFQAQAGTFYQLQASPGLEFSPLAAYLLAPASTHTIILPDGSFTSLMGGLDLEIPMHLGMEKEFYRISAEPSALTFDPALSGDR